MTVQSATPCGPQVQFRRAHVSDSDAIRAFLSRLSASTVQSRFLSPATCMLEEWRDGEVRRMLDANSSKHVVILAVHGREVRGIGESVSEDGGDADIGLVVEDRFQGRGIGKSLFRTLERLAVQRGVRAFTGEIAYGNARALAMLRGTGRRFHAQASYGTVSFTLPLADD